MTQAVRKFKWVVRLGCLAALWGCAQPISSDTMVQPTLTSVSPATGSTDGNTVLTVTGTGFSLNATVTIGGAPCLITVATSSTSATCITPQASAAGAADVAVVNRDFNTGDVLSASLVGAFTYVDAGDDFELTTPTVTLVAPATGTQNGGTTVTITGTNFNYATTVAFGGRTCTGVVATSTTSLTCVTPAQTATGAVNVVATNHHPTSLAVSSGTMTNGYTYTTPVSTPTVTLVSPVSGSQNGNTNVTLTGTNFNSTTTVVFGSRSCTDVVVASSTSLTCITPAQTALGAVDVIATNQDPITTTTASGTMTSGYTYTTPVSTPTVTLVSPVSGSQNGGTPVTLTGTNFNSTTTVTFGSRSCTDVIVGSATSLTCVTPSQSSLGALDVTATNHDPITAATASGFMDDGYTYTSPVVAPTVTLVAPATGSTNGNTTVTLTGTNFNSTTTVTFAGRTCDDVAVVSDTSLTCTTPSQTAAGAVDVIATNHDPITLAVSSGTMTNGYTYTTPLVTPTFVSILPVSGPQNVNTPVTITGTGFDLYTTVSIGGSTCRDVVIASSTTLTCNTPTANAAGAVDVVVSNHDPISLAIDSVTGDDAYTYTAPSFTPVVTNINPAEGPMAGGTVVTITGSNFNLGSLASIAGQNCGSLVVLSTTSLTCTTASVVSGTVADVVVTNRDLETGITYPGTLPSAFTYNPPPTFSSATQGFFMGGTTTTIGGTGFRAGATVTIGGSSCTSVNVSSGTVLTCVAPAGPALTSANVVITNIDGQTVTGINGFTWRQAAFGSANFVDGNGTDGLGHDTTKNGAKPKFVIHNSQLVFASQENNGTANNIRVFRFNGSDSTPVWESLDEDGVNGINNDPTKAATNPKPVVLGTDLWIAWEEIDAFAVSLIRASRYNGDGSSPAFSSLDSGGLNRNTSRQATAPTAAAGTNLFVGFLEENSSNTTEIRVKKWDGLAWANFDTGSAENGLNVNPGKNALSPSMITLGGRIYLAFQETSNTNVETIQVMCNDDETTASWADITAGGLNRDLTHHARNPRIVVYNNKIYVTWVEDSAGVIPQVRISRFDGGSCADTTWVRVDGGAQNVGINKDSTRQAQNPSLGVLDNYLYAAWTESNGVAQNVRSAVLSNEGAGTWTFIDGNGFSGINKDTNRVGANPVLMQFNSKLYGTWSESNGTNTTIRVNVAK